MLSVPHDVFRHGLGTLKDDIGHQHVVEAIQKNVRTTALVHSQFVFLVPNKSFDCVQEVVV